MESYFDMVLIYPYMHIGLSACQISNYLMIDLSGHLQNTFASILIDLLSLAWRIRCRGSGKCGKDNSTATISGSMSMNITETLVDLAPKRPLVPLTELAIDTAAGGTILIVTRPGRLIPCLHVCLQHEPQTHLLM